VRHGTTKRTTTLRLLVAGVLITAVVSAIGATSAGSAPTKAGPHFSEAKAFDVSPPLRDLARAHPTGEGELGDDDEDEGPELVGTPAAHEADAAVQTVAPAATIGPTLVNFEGLRNEDNFPIYGGRVNPPDPVGDVGPNNYVEMVNLTFAVFDKAGNRLLGPSPIGALWEDFPIEDCTEAAGDPIVLYDQTTDRWILTQFTLGANNTPENATTSYNCVAVSKTGDPTGEYYRYAFSTDLDGVHYFPDYPKYGVWSNSYLLTSRDFGVNGEYGISVYGLEKNKMVNGEAKARAVRFFLDGNDEAVLPTVGDGLLPADLDGNRRPQPTDSPAPIVGTQDDNWPYGATSDALNIRDLSVHWSSTPTASLSDPLQLPVAAFDSNYPCGSPVTLGSRDCLPEPGITDPTQFLDILSYRQRPTYRLAYRNFGKYEALVASQSVNAGSVASPQAGMRWYEIRRTNGAYSLYQQGTYAPADGIHRWMGSVAMDKKGDIALGYSVVNGTNVFPGIRYTARLAGDPLGQMTLGEGTIMNGSGVQTTTNSRWGDYTSMNVDPTDDCTFWYVNEYYLESGVPLPAPPPPNNDTRPWRTRIASFKLPGC
jgi:hypothetical protein